MATILFPRYTHQAKGCSCTNTLLINSCNLLPVLDEWFSITENSFFIIPVTSCAMSTYMLYGATLWFFWFLGKLVYNLCFHPLNKIPGPLLARASRWWLFTLEMRENPHSEILELHKWYGMESNPRQKIITIVTSSTRANHEDFSK